MERVSLKRHVQCCNKNVPSNKNVPGSKPFISVVSSLLASYFLSYHVRFDANINHERNEIEKQVFLL